MFINQIDNNYICIVKIYIMTIQQLEYIVALDTYRHFVQAADHCFVTQPTLTMQVQKLEQEIGIALFDRAKKPLEPTVAGAPIIARIKSILLEINQLKSYVFNEKERLEGTYRIGIIPTVSPYLLPLFLQDFTTNYPEVNLQIREMQTVHIIEALKNGSLDIGILVTPLLDQHLRELPIYQEPFLVYLNPTNPLLSEKTLEVSQLPGETLMLLEEGHCFREQALRICGAKSELTHRNFTLQSGSIEGLKNLVKKEVGYTLVPYLSVVDEVDAQYIKRFISPEPSREISIVTHKGFAKELLLEKLAECIQQNLPTALHQLGKSRRISWR
jgi:LysR family hydrogen peroxide-inducible transcriptional activator